MTDHPTPPLEPASLSAVPDLEDRLDLQHLKQLYDSSRLSQIGVLILGAWGLVLVEAYARPHIPLLAAWALALLAGVLLRLVLARRHRQAPPVGPRALRVWQRRTMLVLAYSGTVWGLYPWLAPPLTERMFSAVAAMLDITVCGAALVLITAHRRYYLSFGLPLLILLLARLLLVRPHDILLAVSVFLVFTLLERAANRARRLLATLVSGSEHNTQLIEALRRQERLLAGEHARLRRLVESLPVPIAYCDTMFVLRDCNPGFEQTFLPRGLDPRGRPLAELLGRRLSDALVDQGRRALAGEDRTFETRLPCRTPRGRRPRTFRVSLVPDRRREGEEVAGLYIHLFDITAYKETEARLSVQALHDDLTGVNNRRGFERHVTHMLGHDPNAVHSIIYLDLDRLKDINDRFGHEAGDLALRTFADRLMRAVRREDFCARLGGDEFAVFLRHCPIDCVERVARSIRDSLNQPLVYRGAVLPLSVSIGGVSFLSYSVTFATAMAEADRCMYEAKSLSELPSERRTILRVLGSESSET